MKEKSIKTTPKTANPNPNYKPPTGNKKIAPIDKQPLPKEGAEQAALMSWAQMQSWRWPELKMLFHIPNGGARSKAEAGRFQAEGVKAGVPDLFLPVPRGEWHGLFIELKRREGGRLSEEQKKWIPALQNQGYRVEVCKGWEAAAELIRNYLGQGRADPWD